MDHFLKVAACIAFGGNCSSSAGEIEVGFSVSSVRITEDLVESAFG